MAELNFTYSYGGYVLDGIETINKPTRYKERIASTPGRDGGYSGGALMDTRIVTIKGTLLGTDTGDLRAKQDAFYQAHRPSVANQLIINGDRYCMAEVQSITEADFEGFYLWEYTVAFRADDPYLYDVATQSKALPAGTTTFTVAGTATALPAMSITPSAAGQNVTVTNTTTGDVFSFTAAGSGVYIADSKLETFLSPSSTDASSLLTAASVFLGLANGTNTITVTGGTASLTWQNRYF